MVKMIGAGFLIKSGNLLYPFEKAQQ